MDELLPVDPLAPSPLSVQGPEPQDPVAPPAPQGRSWEEMKELHRLRRAAALRREFDPTPQEVEAQLLQSFQAASTRNPAEVAKARKYAALAGMPVEGAEQNLDVLKGMAAEAQLREAHLSERNPTLARWISNIDVAAIASDDLENLVQLDDWFSKAGRQFGSGREQHELGMLGVEVGANANNRPTLGQAAVIQKLRARIGRAQEEKDFTNAWLNVVGQISKTAPASFAASFGTGRTVAQVTGNPALATLAATIAGFTTTMSQTAAVEGGTHFLELLDQGVDPQLAEGMAMGYGLFAGALEALGAKIVTHPLRGVFLGAAARQVSGALVRPTAKGAGKTFLREWMDSVSGEIGTELGQTLTEAASTAIAHRLNTREGEAGSGETLGGKLDRQRDNRNLDAMLTDPQAATSLGEDLGRTFVDTLMAMGPLGLVLPGAKLAMHDMKRVRKANEVVTWWDNLGNLQSQSTVKERSPKDHKEHLERQIDEKGVPQETLVDARVLRQVLNAADKQAVKEAAEAAGVSTEQMAERMGGQGKVSSEFQKLFPGVYAQLDKAADEGQVIALPTAVYASEVAGTPLHDVLRDHIKFDPHGLTFAEAKEITPEQQQVMDEAKVEMGKLGAEREQWHKERTEIEREMQEVLVATGVGAMNARNAASSAAITGAIATVQARLEGVTPAVWWERNKFTVLSEITDPETARKALRIAQGGGLIGVDYRRVSPEDMAGAGMRRLDGDAPAPAPTPTPAPGDGGLTNPTPNNADIEFGGQNNTPPLPGASGELPPPILSQDILDVVEEAERALRGGPLAQSVTLRSRAENLARYGLEPGKEHLTRSVAQALETRQRKLWGQIPWPTKKEATTPEHLDAMAEWMAEEIEFEASTANSAIGWYSTKFQNALNILAAKFPELATDQTARDLLTLLTAITSDGQEPYGNLVYAVDIYTRFRAGGANEGKLSVGERGHNRTSIPGNLATVQELIDSNGLKKTIGILMVSRSLKELKEIGKANGVDLGTDYNGSEFVPFAAALIGPKLGAFFANLMGETGFLTMDRWWSRTINRYRGSLIVHASVPGLAKFRLLLGRPRMTREESVQATIPLRRRAEANEWKSPLFWLIGRKQPTKKEEVPAWLEEGRAKAQELDELLSLHKRLLASTGDADYLTPIELFVGRRRPKANTKSQKEWIALAKAGLGDGYERKMREHRLLRMFQTRSKQKFTDLLKFGAKQKTLLGNLNKVGPEVWEDRLQAMWLEHQLLQKANTLYKDEFENIEDAPAGPVDRATMVATAKIAQQKLAARGLKLTIADIQAALWYYEKLLYAELGAPDSGQISYEEAATQLIERFPPGSDGRAGMAAALEEAANAAAAAGDEQDDGSDLSGDEGDGEGDGEVYSQGLVARLDQLDTASQLRPFAFRGIAQPRQEAAEAGRGAGQPADGLTRIWSAAEPNAGALLIPAPAAVRNAADAAAVANMIAPQQDGVLLLDGNNRPVGWLSAGTWDIEAMRSEGTLDPMFARLLEANATSAVLVRHQSTRSGMHDLARYLGGWRIEAADLVDLSSGTMQAASEVPAPSTERGAYFQDELSGPPPRDRELIAMVNADGVDLDRLDEFGGFVAPSVGVARASDPYNDFGEMTLIGKPDMVNPEKVAVYSADAYTPTWPTTRQGMVPGWKDTVNANVQRVATELQRLKVGPVGSGMEFDMIERHRKHSEWLAAGNEADFHYGQVAGLAVALMDLGIPLPVGVPNWLAHKTEWWAPVWSARPGLRERVVEATDEILALLWTLTDQIVAAQRVMPMPGDRQVMVDAMRTHPVVAELLDVVMATYRGQPMRSEFVLEEGLALARGGTNAMRFDNTARHLDPSLPAVELRLKDMEKSISTAEVEVAGKWVPRTLGNVLDGIAMQPWTTALEKPGAVNHQGHLRAVLARRFASFDEMIEASKTDLVPPKEHREKVRKLGVAISRRLTSWFTRVSNARTAGGFGWSPDARATFWLAVEKAVLDLGRVAVADWKAVRNMLQSWTIANPPAGVTSSAMAPVPAAQLDWFAKAVSEVATMARDIPADYFEAKPTRLVGLHEFAAAVIPRTLTSAHRAKLTAAGLRIYEYAPRDVVNAQGLPSRKEVVATAAQEMDRETGGGILFQRGFFSAMEREISQVPMQAGTPTAWLQQVTSWRNKGRVKPAEIEFSGIENWLRMVDPSTKITREQVLEWAQEHGTQIAVVLHGDLTHDATDVLPDAKQPGVFETKEWRDLRETIENLTFDDLQPVAHMAKVPPSLLTPRNEGTTGLRLEREDQQFLLFPVDGKAWYPESLHSSDKGIVPWTYWGRMIENLDAPAHARTVQRVHITVDPDTRLVTKARVYAEHGTVGTAAEGTLLKALRLLNFGHTDRQKQDAERDAIQWKEALGNFTESLKRMADEVDQISTLEDAQLHLDMMASKASRVHEAASELRGGLDSASKLVRQRLRDLRNAATGPNASSDGQGIHHGQRVPGMIMGSGEIILTLPHSTTLYEAPAHWSDPNPLVHARITWRRDANGEPLMFVEEIQSDWAQAGIGKGFSGDEQKDRDRENYLDRLLMGLAPFYEKLASTESVEKLLEDQTKEGGRNSAVFLEPKEYHADIRTMAKARAHDLQNGTRKLKTFVEQKRTEQKNVVERLKGIQHGGTYYIAKAPFVERNEEAVALMLKKLLMIAAQEGVARIMLVSGKQNAQQWSYESYETVEIDEANGQVIYRSGNNVLERVPYDPTNPESLARIVEPDELAELAKGNPMVGATKEPATNSKGEVGVGYHIRMADGQLLSEGGNSQVAWFIDGADADNYLATRLKRGAWMQHATRRKKLSRGRLRFYDVLVPQIAKGIVEKLGGSMGTTTLESSKVYRLTHLQVEDISDQLRGDLSGQAHEAAMEPTRSWAMPPSNPTFRDLLDEGLPSPTSYDWSDVRAELVAMRDRITKARGTGVVTHLSWMRADRAIEFLIEANDQAAKAQGPDIGDNVTIEITSPMLASINDGLPLFASEMRGAFLPGAWQMLLFSKADLSTFLHESGHAYLIGLFRAAQSSTATASTKARAAQFLRWFGLSSFAEWKALKEDQRTAFHEQFTYLFEIYLARGQAPSLALRRPFDDYRRWLTDTYQGLIVERLGEEYRRQFGRELPILTGEVGQLFDSILASDAEVAEMEIVRNMLPVFTTQAESGYDDAKWQRYQEALEEARLVAREKVNEQAVAGMQWLSKARAKILSDLQRTHDQVRLATERKVRAELLQRPIYRALSWLSTGRLSDDPNDRGSRVQSHQIDSDDVPKVIGQEAWDRLIAKFGVGRGTIFGQRHGFAADQVAEMFELGTGEQLLRALLDEPTLEEAVTAETDARMLRDHSNLTDPAQRDEFAARALQTEARAHFMALEVQALEDSLRRDADAVTPGMPAKQTAAAAQVTQLEAQLKVARERSAKLRDERVQTPEESQVQLDLDALRGELQAARKARDRVKVQTLTAQRNQLQTQLAGLEPPELGEAARKVEELEVQLRGARRVAAGPVASEKIVQEAARAAAEKVVAETPLRELRTLRARSEAAQSKASRDVLRAMKAGKQAEALQAARLRLRHHEIARAATEALEELEKGRERVAKLWASPDERMAKRRDVDIVNAARDLAAAHGLATPRKNEVDWTENLRNHDPARYEQIRAWVEEAKMQGTSYLDMTPTQLRTVFDRIESLFDQSRRDHLVKVGTQWVPIVDALQKLGAKLDAISPAKVEEIRSQTTGWEKMRTTLSSIKAWLRRVEHWAHGLGSEFVAHIWRPVQDAQDRYRAKTLRYTTRYLDGLRDLQATLPKGRIVSKELGWEFGKANGGQGLLEVLGAILHCGNASNYRKLLLGYGWGEEDAKGGLDDTLWREFLEDLWNRGVLKQEHLDWVQSVWDMLEELKPDAQRAHRDVFGTYFTEIKAEPFLGPWTGLRGGYVPAKADRTRNDPGQQRYETMEDLRADFRQSMPATPSGFRHSRVENYAVELNLSPTMVARHIDEQIRFSEVQPAIRDVLRILNDGEFEAKLGRVDPEAKRSMLLPWLARVANASSTKPGTVRAWDRFWATVRRNTGAATMFGNLSNSLQNVANVLPALTMVPAGHMAKAFGAYIRNPRQMTRDVRKLSSYMDATVGGDLHRLQTELAQLADNSGIWRRFTTWSQANAYWLQQVTQSFSSVATWQAAYNHYCAKAAATRTHEDVHTEAVAHADSVVRRSQSDTTPGSVAAYEGTTAFGKVLFQFSGYFNNLANANQTAAVKLWRELGWSMALSPRTVWAWALGMAAPLFIAEVISRAFSGRWRDDDDEEGLTDPALRAFGWAQLSGGMAMLPGVAPGLRAIANATDDLPWNDRLDVSPTFTALLAGTSGLVKAGFSAADDGKLTDREWTDVLTGVSLWTAVPVRGIDRLIDQVTPDE